MSNAYAAATARRSPLGFIVVVAMHVGLVLVINQALGLRLLVEKPPAPMQGRVVTIEPKPVEERELLPPLPRTPVIVDYPDVPPLVPATPDEGATGIELDPPADPGPGSADPLPQAPLRIGARLDARHPLTQPAYPAGSIRLEETGVVELELRIGRDGRVIEARVLRSSGHARLDRAAVAEALRAWRLQPATLDGEPVEDVYRIQVTFRLDD